MTPQEAAQALADAATLIKEQDARYARLVDAFHQHRNLLHLQADDVAIERSVERVYAVVREQQ